MMLTQDDRDRFDRLLEEIIAALPQSLHDLIDETGVIVDDLPPDEMLRRLAKEHGEPHPLHPLNLFGLHTGVDITRRTVEQGGSLAATDQIHLFRAGIIYHSGGFHPNDPNTEARVAKQIRITLLHEIGHHYGLDEDDLEALGYG